MPTLPPKEWLHAPIWYVVNVEGIVFDPLGRVLMITRSAQEPSLPNALTFPGGKVESAGETTAILEETLQRELREETGIEIKPDPRYVLSKSFISEDGRPFVDIVFLCSHLRGEPRAADPAEVAAAGWMPPAEVFAHPAAGPWTKASLRRALALREKTP